MEFHIYLCDSFVRAFVRSFISLPFAKIIVQFLAVQHRLEQALVFGMIALFGLQTDRQTDTKLHRHSGVTGDY